ncbi:MAG: malto-oligosyltrehalose trehalohydrolase [Nitrospira sp.]|jgi:maltooligosyltrehalose trehalohydrolase|nr:MAG: malto-oligosyltrehalose trehalohydrolase [Nitrospira sp.]
MQKRRQAPSRLPNQNTEALQEERPECGALFQDDGRVRWRVWAPKAKRVELVLIDGESRVVRPMEQEEQGYFSFTSDRILSGQRYSYRLDGGPERPDPASRWQPDGVSLPSAVLDPDEFRWTDAAWSGIPREGLAFYELHVGTFTPEGTFDAVIPRLPALQELGVTAIELMPVAQFSGTRNWGYDGVHPYAPQHSYGGPHGLQRLVDACHRHGLAVFLDVVYNHIGPEGAYLAEFGPYFTERYRTPWGAAVNYDEAGSDHVRQFVLDNVRMWIRDYHFDGLRLDAIHAIYDFGARHILRDIKEAAQAASEGRDYGAYIVAESDLNDVRIVLPREQGGYGLDAQWSDDFHHAVHTCLTGERQGYYIDYGRPEQLAKALTDTFVFDGCYSRSRDRRHGGSAEGLPGDRFVVCTQNHDQIGNRAAGDRLSTLLPPPAQRLAASLMLLAPYLPLLFMGEEYGEPRPFQFFCSFSDPALIENVRAGRRREFEAFHRDGDVPDPQAESTFAASRLSWSWEADPHRAGLRRLYQDLLRARREWPALRDGINRTARLLPTDDPVLELTRGKFDSQDSIRALFNLSAQEQRIPDGVSVRFHWSSEAEQYHGTRRADLSDRTLLPYECLVFNGI